MVLVRARWYIAAAALVLIAAYLARTHNHLARVAIRVDCNVALAREWIAAMTTTCVADRLVRDYDRDPAIRDFVDRHDLWIVPVANPDGYQHSWSADRYWRKNRRDGHGVDLNRNFGVAWGGAGSS